MTTRRIADLAATHVTVSARDETTGEEVSIQLPIVRGSAGAPAVDISTLPAATGLYTLDPGFVATGSCIVISSPVFSSLALTVTWVAARSEMRRVVILGSAALRTFSLTRFSCESAGATSTAMRNGSVW